MKSVKKFLQASFLGISSCFLCTFMEAQGPKVQTPPSSSAKQAENLPQVPSTQSASHSSNIDTKKGKEPTTPSIDYAAYLKAQLAIFASQDFSKKLAALPTNEPIVKIAIPHIQTGLQKIFSLAEKIQPGFSTIAYFFALAYVGGPNCPGVDNNTPCYVLLFPQGDSLAPLICFKAKTDSMVIKNLQTEENKKGKYQLMHPFPLSEKEYNAWFCAPRTLLSNIKDFSTIAPFFYGKSETFSSTVRIEFNQKVLGSFLPFPLLQCFYDTYIQNDFEKIVYDISCDDIDFQLTIRHQAKSNSPWVAFCKTVHGALKTHRTLDLPSNSVQLFAFCPYQATRILLEALSTRAQLSNWQKDELSHQLYQWGQIFYPIWIDCLKFGEKYLTGNEQHYGSCREITDILSLQETNPSLTDAVLVSFLQNSVQKFWQPQIESAKKKNLCESDSFNGVFSFDKEIEKYKDCILHKVSFGMKSEGFFCPKIFGIYRGYLLSGEQYETLHRLIDQMKNIKTFSYIAQPEFFGSLKVNLTDLEILGLKFPPNTYLELSSTVEISPETLVVRLKIPVAAFEKICAFCLQGESPSPTPSSKESENPTPKADEAEKSIENAKKIEKTSEQEGKSTEAGKTPDKRESDKNIASDSTPQVKQSKNSLK